MRRLRGKDRDQVLTPHQYCNDWISFDTADGRSGVVNPGQVRLDPEDFEFFAARDPDHPEHGECGSFWQEWRLNDDGTFECIAPRVRRRRAEPSR